MADYTQREDGATALTGHPSFAEQVPPTLRVHVHRLLEVVAPGNAHLHGVTRDDFDPHMNFPTARHLAAL